MWLLPVLPFLTMRIWVVMRSDMVSVWLMTPTFLPCDDWSIASASMTVESVSGSSVPIQRQISCNIQNDNKNVRKC